MLAIISELSEVLDEANFKWWKKQGDDDAKLHEEIVDVLHFYKHVHRAQGLTRIRFLSCISKRI